MTEPIREIAFDTETTGLNWDQDDRVIELGAVELINHIPTGKTFQTHINPGRPVSEATIRITGITDNDLIDKPRFEAPEIVDAFLDFIGDSTLVAHNASFDRGFLNMELQRCDRDPVPEDRWVDTVALARKRYPGAPASLDALCKRYDISLESRTYHGALLDSLLLSEVYLELLGGRARAFDFGSTKKGHETVGSPAKCRPALLAGLVTPEEEQGHSDFVSGLSGSPLWALYT